MKLVISVFLALSLVSGAALAVPFGASLTSVETCTGDLDIDNEITVFAIPFRNAKSKKTDSFLLIEQTSNKLDGSSIATSFVNTSRTIEKRGAPGKSVTTVTYSNGKSGMRLVSTTTEETGAFGFVVPETKTVYFGGSAPMSGMQVKCN